MQTAKSRSRVIGGLPGLSECCSHRGLARWRSNGRPPKVASNCVCGMTDPPPSGFAHEPAILDRIAGRTFGLELDQCQATGWEHRAAYVR
jgi:hypothetical protein